MKTDPKFINKPKDFWAAIRTLGQTCGYTERASKTVKVPSLAEMIDAYKALHLNHNHLVDEAGNATSYSQSILDYCQYRANILNTYVEKNLMDAEEAGALFHSLKLKLQPKCPLPMNKQKGDKKAHNYLTGMVNMLIENGLGQYQCNFDPRELTTVTKDGLPFRTLSRRVDGAFPSAVNPIALWEIKEYYYTTTFGSRVADGVYETLVDGMEIEEMEIAGGRRILHYLFVDSHYTWWVCGKSYLCRLIDMMHMGYVDEIIFGKEVVTRLPEITKSLRGLV